MPAQLGVRFAPSTGKLHVGNARTALVNWLFARAVRGTFILRFDDTDMVRSEARHADAIRDDLLWLGLTWDENEHHQSQRLALYAQAAERLEKQGRLYPCYETTEELDLQRKVQLARHRPPVYDRGALRLTEADRARFEAEGRKPHWRFKLDHRKVEWNDRIRGPVAIDAASLSEPVLRADGVPLYTLASVVDDMDLHVTHVIRGEDHVTNTVQGCITRTHVAVCLTVIINYIGVIRCNNTTAVVSLCAAYKEASSVEPADLFRKHSEIQFLLVCP